MSEWQHDVARHNVTPTGTYTPAWFVRPLAYFYAKSDPDKTPLVKLKYSPLESLTNCTTVEVTLTCHGSAFPTLEGVDSNCISIQNCIVSHYVSIYKKQYRIIPSAPSNTH